MKSFIWEIDAQSSRETELRVKKISFGDGYEQTFSEGINNQIKKWTCKCTGYRNAMEIIYNFLTATKGVTPFLIPTLDNGIYRVDGGIAFNHVGGDTWSVSFNLKQVFGA